MQRKLTTNERICLSSIRKTFQNLRECGVTVEPALSLVNDILEYETNDGKPIAPSNDNLGAYVMSSNDNVNWEGPRILARAMINGFLVVSPDNSCHWTAKYCRFATDEEIAVMEANNVAEAA
jgi:hypothetical protein